MKVLISGAGIGGLTAALCCQHQGHEVVLLEQAPALGEVGAGIQIPPNAMKVFQTLGIDDAIRENTFTPTAIETSMGISGREVFNIPLGDYAAQRWGAPYLHIHREDYIAALAKNLTSELRLNADVSGYEQEDDGVTVRLAAGETISGDVLIGADGIHSTIRNQMRGPDQPRFTGCVAWRAVVPIELLGDNAPAPTACAWMGPGRHAVTYRLRRGQLVNFVGVVERDDWTKESWSEAGSKEDALQDFAGWHPVITHLIRNIPDGNLFRWALFDRAPLDRWCDGRVALLGDAAHPMLPFMAQGAAMAVEDGWAIADELGKDGPIQKRLKAYQGRRLNRTAKAQAASRANTTTFHKRGLARQLMTYGPMWIAGKTMPNIVHARMDWLYGHDETAVTG